MRKGRRTKWAAAAMALLLAGGTMLGGAAVMTPVTAHAETIIPGGTVQTTGSLTINKKDSDGNALAGAEFSVYKVMSLTPSTNAGEYASYAIESAFASVLDGVTPDALNNYSAAVLETKIDDLANVAKDLAPADKQETAASTGSCTFSNLALGYYLVVETKAPNGFVAGRPFLIAIPSTNNYNNSASAGTEWVYDVTAEPKNSDVPLKKELAEGEDGSYGIGDFVKYVVTTKMPVYDSSYGDDVKFVITDVMSDGLEIQKDATHPVEVKIAGNTVAENKAATYEAVAANSSGNVADLTITFVPSYIKANGGKSVEVIYYAKITDKAVTGTEGNPNEVNIEYNRKPGETTEGTPVTVKVYSFNIDVVKFTNEGGTKALKDAEFELYKTANLTADSKVGTATTDENGKLSFAKLDEGAYYLKETKAPVGYTLLTNPIKVEIIATENNGVATGEFTLKVDDTVITATSGEYVTQLNQESGTSTVAVENHKGFTLPHTGGSGIVIFLVVGLAGIACISVVMIRKTKKAN